MPKSIYTRYNKYRVVGKILQDADGSLLDFGARDKRLATELNLQRISYYSADIETGHDYQLDLEKRLELPDQAFDYVIALDVLEHTEHIHQAFFELARITKKKLIIGLPNMSSLLRRFLYLRYGHLGTKKYHLYPHHQGDRHRWLTIYQQINRFIETNATKANFRVEQVFEEIETGIYGKLGVVIATLVQQLLKTGLISDGLFTGRCIHVLVRNQDNC